MNDSYFFGTFMFEALPNRGQITLNRQTLCPSFVLRPVNKEAWQNCDCSCDTTATSTLKALSSIPLDLNLRGVFTLAVAVQKHGSQCPVATISCVNYPVRSSVFGGVLQLSSAAPKKSVMDRCARPRLSFFFYRTSRIPFSRPIT